MDFEKLSGRITHGARESLKVQKLHSKIDPIKLVEHREGKYFLVQCLVNERKTNLLFVRSDKWYFYVQGMHSLPPKMKRRGYDNSSRANEEAEQKDKKRKEDVNQIEKSLDQAIKSERKRQ